MAQTSDQLPEKNLKNVAPSSLPLAKNLARKQPESRSPQEHKQISTQDDDLPVNETLKLLENLEKKGRELKKQLDKLYEIRGVTPEFLNAYMSNPNNFTSEEWANFRKHRQDYLDSLTIPPDLVDMTKGLLGDVPAAKPPRASEGNKSKLERASRRSWWLRVR